MSIPPFKGFFSKIKKRLTIPVLTAIGIFLIAFLLLVSLITTPQQRQKFLSMRINPYEKITKVTFEVTNSYEDTAQKDEYQKLFEKYNTEKKAYDDKIAEEKALAEKCNYNLASGGSTLNPPKDPLQYISNDKVAKDCMVRETGNNAYSSPAKYSLFKAERNMHQPIPPDEKMYKKTCGDRTTVNTYKLFGLKLFSSKNVESNCPIYININ